MLGRLTCPSSPSDQCDAWESTQECHYCYLRAQVGTLSVVRISAIRAVTVGILGHHFESRPHHLGLGVVVFLVGVVRVISIATPEWRWLWALRSRYQQLASFGVKGPMESDSMTRLTPRLRAKTNSIASNSPNIVFSNSKALLHMHVA
jgi:hypothetical protein